MGHTLEANAKGLEEIAKGMQKVSPVVHLVGTFASRTPV